MFDIGFQELVIIFIVALLVVGPKKLPEVGRQLGRGIAELKRALQGFRDTIQEEENLLKKEIPDFKEEVAASLRTDPEEAGRNGAEKTERTPPAAAGDAAGDADRKEDPKA